MAARPFVSALIESKDFRKTVALVLIVGLLWWIIPGPCYRYAKLIPRIESIRYSGNVEYSPDSELWLITDEVQIPSEKSVNDLLTDQFRLDSRNGVGAQKVKTLTELMLLYGWNDGGAVDDSRLFTRKRTQPAITRWMSVRTTNVITLPEIRYRYLILRPTANSKLVLVAPKYTVGKTRPSYVSRSDLPGDSEVLTIPTDFQVENVPRLEVELLSPLLRSELGNELVQASIWTPVKWILLALCAIFGDQIRRGILIPLVKKTFAVLHIRFRDDEPPIPRAVTRC